jgi:hypothetical protein
LPILTVYKYIIWFGLPQYNVKKASLAQKLCDNCPSNNVKNLLSKIKQRAQTAESQCGLSVPLCPEFSAATQSASQFSLHPTPMTATRSKKPVAACPADATGVISPIRSSSHGRRDDRCRPYAFAFDAFYTFMVNSSSSSTGSRKRMPPELCLLFRIAYPHSKDIIRRYCCVVRPLIIKMQDLAIENHKLIELRDFLLPALMNGQAFVDV